MGGAMGLRERLEGNLCATRNSPALTPPPLSGELVQGFYFGTFGESGTDPQGGLGPDNPCIFLK